MDNMNTLAQPSACSGFRSTASLRRRRPVGGLLALVCVAALLQARTLGRTADRQMLQGHLPAAVGRLPAMYRLPGTNRLDLAIGLPMRNRSALDRLIAELYDSASPLYHQYVTPEQFTERFGPPQQDYDAVIAFAKAHRLRVTGTHPNRTLLDVNGTVADI